MGLPTAIVRRVGERVAAHAGLHPPAWVLEARLDRRIAALGLAQPDRYAELVESEGGARELEVLIESLRVGETRFFRHRAQVQAVTEAVVPALARIRGGGPVRAWSAGCASGEEAYTLAMLLAGGLPAPGFQVSVLATDISRDALAVARAGEYPAAALAQVPDRLRRAAFEPAGESRVRVAAAMRRRVRFEQHNLADEDYPRPFDLIWCRNVLIYFAPEARRAAVLRLIDSLAPGGFLFVGYAETLRHFDALEAVRTPDALLYRKRERPAHATPTPTPTPRPAPAPAATPIPPPAPGAVPAAAPARAPDAGASGIMRAASHLVAETTAMVALRGNYDGARLAREVEAALSGPYQRIVIDLDGAEYLDDDAGPVLRRVVAAARAAGVQVVLLAERQGMRRWLTRSGALPDPEDSP